MTDPIVTTTRVSDRPVRWCVAFRVDDAFPDGAYALDIIGYGKTPALAQANATANLDRVKLRMFVASLAFKTALAEITESAET